MHKLIIAMIFICFSQPVIAQETLPFSESEQSKVVLKSTQLLSTGDPAATIKLVNPVISAYEQEYAKLERKIFCSNTPEKAMVLILLSAGKSAKNIADQKKATEKKLIESPLVLSENWCLALFLKGFALIDVKRFEEAEPFLRRASEMAPLNAHYANEYAEWHKTKRNWQKSYDLFEQAIERLGFSSKEYRNKQHARALRGMGFALIELEKLDKAEVLFKKSIEFDPQHPNAKIELDYIESLRKKQK